MHPAAGHEGVCFWGSALLLELLRRRGIAATMRFGYHVFPDERMALWHVWVQLDHRRVLDVGCCVVQLSGRRGSRYRGYSGDAAKQRIRKRRALRLPHGTVLQNFAWELQQALHLWHAFERGGLEGFWRCTNASFQGVREAMLWPVNELVNEQAETLGTQGQQQQQQLLLQR